MRVDTYTFYIVKLRILTLLNEAIYLDSQRLMNTVQDK